MKLALGKRQIETAGPKDAVVGHEKCRKRQDFFLLCIRSLLQFIKEFSLDLKELESDAFKLGINQLGEKFNADEKLRSVRSAFEKQKKKIHRHIDRQKNHLLEREKELKDIIDLLAKAMVTLDTENQTYHQKIYAQSEKIEQITRLDDIKKIKQSLIHEIENIRQTIHDKQVRDTQQLEILSKQVRTLNHDLKKAKVDSVTDGLTGIYNRKAFDQHIRELVQQNTIAETPFSILMLDVDNFKEINDTYGHQTGDRVLLALAQKCSRMIRNEDFIARYGGEEFVMVLARASLRNATQKAQRMCKTISNTCYSMDDIKAGYTLSITASIGVSTYRKGDTAKSIIDRVDQALYVAKRSGKNRVASEKELKSV